MTSVPAPDARQAFYQRFEADVRGLAPAQRKALADSLTTKLVEAQKSGRLDAASHYSRLLEILYRYPVK